MAISSGYITKVKTSLRVTSDDESFVTDITDLITAAQADLILAGILPDKARSESDSLIQRAVTTYCKANFGLDNPDMEKYTESYKSQKKELLLTEEYTTAVIEP